MTNLLSDERLNASSLTSRLRQGSPLSLLFFKVVLKFLAREVRQEKQKSSNPRRVSKTVFICRWCDFTTCRKMKDSTKAVRLINRFSKVARYKSNKQKVIAFIYINNELPKRKIKKMIAFIIASEKIKYLLISLSKEVKDLYI